MTLAVISWNLDAGRGELGRLVSDLSSGRLTASPVADFVLLVQEVADEELRGLQAPGSGGPLTTFFAPVRSGPGRTSGNAILSTVPLSGGRVIELPRERQPRAAAAASLEVAGERLFVVSAHFENRLSWVRGLFGDSARKRQADALLAALPPSGHGIVGGDLNTMLGPSEPALDALLDRFDDTPRDGRQPTFRDRLVLDHVFFDLPDGWRVERRVVEDRYGSDHHPVLGLIAADR